MWRVRDEVCFDEGDGDDDQNALHEEGGDQCAATMRVEVACHVGESEGADEEGGDGDEGFEPAPGFAGGKA